MSLILKGIDMPEPIKDQYTHLELYVRSDGVVFDDDLEEVGQAIQIDRPHGRLIDENLTYIDKTIDGYFEIYAPTILEAEE